jgi:hypothetical protein
MRVKKALNNKGALLARRKRSGERGCEKKTECFAIKKITQVRSFFPLPLDSRGTPV